MLNKITSGKYSLHLLGKEEREILYPWALRIVINLVCPHCKYSDKYFFVVKIGKDFSTDYHEILKPEMFHSPGKYEVIKSCPKCGKSFKYKVKKNCKWKQEELS